jgi:hypothetical protein
MLVFVSSTFRDLQDERAKRLPEQMKVHLVSLAVLFPISAMAQSTDPIW